MKIGFFGTLTIVFIILKLCDVITWSWWWILSPTWIPACIVIVFLAAIGISITSNPKRRSKYDRQKSGNP